MLQVTQSGPKPSVSPNHLLTHKAERPEMYSIDNLDAFKSGLLKRTNESASCSDFHTTLSDLIKHDSSVIMNGTPLSLNNVNSNSISKNDSMLLDLTSCNSGTPSVTQNVASNDRTVMRGSDSVSLLMNNSPSNKNHAYSTSPCIKETSQAPVSVALL